MKYNDYSAADFANDSFFIRWVRKPDAESNWFWESFLQENPGCRESVEEARRLIKLFDFKTDDLDEADQTVMRNRLLMGVRANTEEDKEERHVRKLMPAHAPWWKMVAAIIVIPLVICVILLLIRRTNSDTSLADNINEGRIENRYNPIGQKSVLLLSDGTKVWVNAATRISYMNDFTHRTTRDVYLEGEAFFEVAHNPDQPFIVHTSGIDIKVLGTSFNVKCYPEEETIETTLVNGKVQIQQSDAKGNRIGDVELKPNQRAVFNKESKVINIEQVTEGNGGSWRQEKLVFDGESIDDVFRQMERWYNVRIHVENKGRLDCKLTATIENESLEEVLKLLEGSYPIEYTIRNRDVYIEGTLCGAIDGK